MSRLEDSTLMMDMLGPFRRAVGRPSTSTAASTSASTSTSTSTSIATSARSLPTRLSFDDSLTDIMGKRKTSFDANCSPSLKRSRTESDTSPSPGAGNGTDSPWSINRYKAEALDSRVQIDNLKKQIAHQHFIRKEMEELFENERRTHVNECKSKDKAVSDAEQRFQTMKSKETDLKEQLSKALRELNEFKNIADKEKQQLQNDIYNLKTDFTNSKIALNDQISSLRRDNAELSQNNDNFKKQMAEYKAAYEEASIENSQLQTLQEKFDQQCLALHRAESKLRDLESSKKDIEDMKVLQKRLHSMPALEKEATRLRKEISELRVASQQNLMLEEKIHYFKTRLEFLEPLYQNYCDLQKKHVELEKTLDEWRRVGSAYDAPEPQLLISKWENLQKREIALLSEKKENDVLLSSVKTESANVNLEYKKTLTKLNDAQNVQKTQESFIHRLQKKLLLLSRERDSYRQQLDCYEKELTVSVGIDTQHGSVAANNRVESLEKNLQGYRELVSKLEDEISNMKGMPILHEQLSRLKEEVMNLTRDNEVLRSHNDKLEIQLERSLCKVESNNVPSVKLIHLTDNPLSKAQEDVKNELTKAHLEIQQLKHKIKRLEANELEITQKLNETLQIDHLSAKEVEQLKSQLESTNIKLQRMKEVYNSNLQEYKNVFYMLFGYQMDRTGVNNYRLSSMYAESPDEYLCFTLSDKGIDMVQSDYAMAIEDLVEEHLHGNKSFPVFLSELTLDLFKKTTMLSDSTIHRP